jgi:hypothetical protein
LFLFFFPEPAEAIVFLGALGKQFKHTGRLTIVHPPKTFKGQQQPQITTQKKSSSISSSFKFILSLR